MYGEDKKLTKNNIGYKASLLYLNHSVDIASCGNYIFPVNVKQFKQIPVAKFPKDYLIGKVFGLMQADTEVSDSIIVNLLKYCHCLITKKI